MAPTENSVQQGMAPSLNNNCSAPYAPDINCRFSVNQFNTSCIEAQEKQQMLDCEQALSKKRTTRKRSKNPTQVQNLASLVGIVHYGQLPNCPAEGAPKHNDMQGYEISHYPKTCMEALSADTHAMRTKKRTKRNSSGDSVTTGAIQKRIFPVDEIVEQIKSLSINSESKTPKNQTPNSLIPCGLRYEEQNAIVLYQRDGTIIPFEGSFNPSWRRRPRPKVDLDDETTRVWKLLLENINSEGIDGTDEEKAKWWQEERRVFRGRADSFIARMHLVQGDRRFSPWKGSVVDSVIGVFLTQNVSDHLSSSAFMSLAAQFPLKPDTNSMTCSEETNTLAKEPEVSILDPEDVIKWHEDKLNQPACDSSSMTLHDMDYNVEKEVVNSNELLQCSSGTETSSDNLKCRLSDIPGNGLTKPNFMSEKRENDVLSSQCSAGSSQNTLESSKKQTAERKGLQQEYLEADLKARSSDLVGASFLELLQRAETFHGLNENGHNFREGTECGTQKQNKEVSESSKASPRPIAPSPNYHLHMISNSRELEIESIEMVGEESLSSNHYRKNEENCTSEQSGVTAESVSQSVVQKNLVVSLKEAPNSASENNQSCSSCQEEENKFIGIQNRPDGDPKDCVESQTQGHNCIMQHALDMPTLSRETLDATDSTSVIDCTRNIGHKEVVSGLKDHGCLPGKVNNKLSSNSSKVKRGSTGRQKQKTVDWDSLRLQAQANGRKREQTANTMDSLDWEAVRCADVNDIADTIKARGMNNMLAERIKAFLNRLVREHGSIDLEWLRDVPPDKAKEYLLSIRGLGLKSVECVRLLTLHHLAFPVDTNVGRIAVRLGWVPLQPLPESLQLHLLELYPVLESIQKYLWPRLCKLDQRTLYELHYQMITFGKVFCTKSKPNCNACPMRGECRHFASAFASARLALPGPEERSIVSATEDKAASQNPVQAMKPLQSLPQASQQLQMQSQINRCEPIVEEPATPEPIIEVPATPELEPVVPEHDIEDAFCEDPEEIPTIKLNIDVFTQNLQNYMQQNMELQEGDMCKALVALNPEAASIPAPKLKNVSRLRTEHQVYELPDSHPLLEGLDKREPDDPCSYLLAIWAPGETASSIQLPERKCSSQEFGKLCDDKTCFSCNSIREADSQTVRGTLLIPCRTAMRGSFPLNGTYFQVNEVFADHESSINPIDVPRSWIWNLPRRTVYFGTSIPTIFKGLSTESIQYCFWRGFVCVRGFDQKTRAPRPLMARLHFPASKLTRTRGNNDERLE
ncbi:DNA-(apurinic or apyrimidinic site) lyase [Bertholletia excelsa]